MSSKPGAGLRPSAPPATPSFFPWDFVLFLYLEKPSECLDLSRHLGLYQTLPRRGEPSLTTHPPRQLLPLGQASFSSLNSALCLKPQPGGRRGVRGNPRALGTQISGICQPLSRCLQFAAHNSKVKVKRSKLPLRRRGSERQRRGREWSLAGKPSWGPSQNHARHRPPQKSEALDLSHSDASSKTCLEPEFEGGCGTAPQQTHTQIVRPDRRHQLCL